MFGWRETPLIFEWNPFFFCSKSNSCLKDLKSIFFFHIYTGIFGPLSIWHLAFHLKVLVSFEKSFHLEGVMYKSSRRFWCISHLEGLNTSLLLSRLYGTCDIAPKVKKKNSYELIGRTNLCICHANSLY